MKKIFAFAVAVLASASMFAQAEVGAISVTPKVGINIATITGDGDQKSKVGFVAGAEAAYQTTEQIAVSAGVLYSNQGTKFDSNNKINLNYLSIPVLANYYIVKGLSVKAGIQPSILLSAKQKVELYGVSAEADVKENCKKFDLAIPVGVSYEYCNVVLDARYNIGLTNVFKDADQGKNSVLQITCGYKF